MLAFNACKRGNENVITVYLNGKSYVVGNSNPALSRIKQLLVEYNDTGSTDEDELLALMNPKTAITVKSGGKVVLKGEDVYYDGKLLHHAMVNRIRDTLDDGWPVDHLLKFLENLMENVSYRVVQELGDFLANKNLPITPRGTFLGYKKVDDDYRDFYSHTFDNSPGQVVEMPRNGVDDNRDHECSAGLHVGGLEYAANQYHPSRGRIVVVEVDPRDCVSVPKDHNAQKLRTFKYTVVADYTGPLPNSVYDNGAEPTSYDQEDEDYVPQYVEDKFGTKYGQSYAAPAKNVQGDDYYNDAGW